MKESVEKLRTLAAEVAEHVETFSVKGIKKSATKARKALGEIKKLALQLRKDLMEAKSADKK